MFYVFFLIKLLFKLTAFRFFTNIDITSYQLSIFIGVLIFIIEYSFATWTIFVFHWFVAKLFANAFVTLGASNNWLSVYAKAYGTI